MGMAKRSDIELSDYLKGSVSRIALSGGYLYIYRGGRLLHIASIPSPNLLAEYSADSTVENVDSFTDEEGNAYTIVIHSMKTGVMWSLDQHPVNLEVIKELHYAVRLNDD